MDSFLGYGRQNIEDDDIQAVIDVLKGDALTQGPAVEQFEVEFSRYTGSSHSIAVANGTAALHLASLALDLGPGDAVIVPALTFAATSNAVLYTGATPIFSDIDRDSLCIAPDSIEEAIWLAKKEGLKPKAIYPVHYAGHPCAMSDIFQIAAEHQLEVVEDCCHALGARYKTNQARDWIHVGTGKAAFGIFSFHPVKHITTGEGGCLTTQDLRLAKRVRQLRSHGITKDPVDFVNPTLSMEEKRENQGQINPWYHEMQILGYNFRLSDIQAALGLAQMRKLEKFVAKRRHIAQQYVHHFGGAAQVLRLPPSDSAYGFHSYHLFPLQIDFQKIGMTRSELMIALQRKLIGTQVHYLPVFWHPFYANHSDLWRSVQCDNATDYYTKTLSVPIHPGLSDADVTRVANSVLETIG